MAGHSHWSNIKRKKEAVDAKRGKIWTKASRALALAASMGGGDPAMNPRLRLAISEAKSARMPNDTIERAIKKGTGESNGGAVEEILYEGYGAGGVAVMCDIMTDNRNRTAPQIRKIFDSHGGKLGATGCVAWNFDRKGIITVAAGKVSEEELLEIALEAGAEDVKQEGDSLVVLCEPEIYSDLQQSIEESGVEIDDSQVTRLPKETIEVTGKDARKLLKLMEA
ncbi:MAG: YebC/PmpR family DNA-binding transcriptional regulator, partial [Blastopirellula sp. JB062]